MTRKSQNGEGPVTRQDRRLSRLEEALRANLKKREDLARARGGTPSREDAAQAPHSAGKAKDSGDGGAGT